MGFVLNFEKEWASMYGLEKVDRRRFLKRGLSLTSLGLGDADLDDALLSFKLILFSVHL